MVPKPQISICLSKARSLDNHNKIEVELFGLFREFFFQSLIGQHEDAAQRDAHFVQMGRRLCRITDDMPVEELECAF